MNVKVCPNCGKNNDINASFCENCGKKLEQNNIANTETNNSNPVNNNNSEATKLGVISLVLYFLGSSVTSFIAASLPKEIGIKFSSLIGLCPLAGIVVMIIGRVKYPNNKFLKIVMWIIIACIILSVIAIILFMLWCFMTCESLNRQGCN